MKSKVAFGIGLTPKIEQSDQDYRKFIPEPYQSVLVISADFELAWAWQYAKAFSNPLKAAINFARQARKNIPNIITLCEKYNVPITWATVGHVFLEECKSDNGLSHPNLRRLAHFENNYWKFDSGDWFQHDPCSNYVDAPEWYAPDLIDMILNSMVKHEIGCHTFSHIDCGDQVCTPEVLEGEIRECQKLAEKFGINLKSFVHPGHTIGNLETLKRLGITSYRTDYGNVLGYPNRHKSGLWELKGTMELTFRYGWSVEYHIYRYKKIVERAIKHKKVCNLWFHPSLYSIFVEKVMPPLFEFIQSHKDMIWITTAGEYVGWLEERNRSRS